MDKALIKELERLSMLKHLECDGMTRVVTHLLTKHRLSHEVCTGYVSLVNVPRWVKERTITHHWWVELDSEDGFFLIDYRARMWLGDHKFVAHGVFRPDSFPKTVYREKQRGAVSVPDFVFDILTHPTHRTQAL